MCSVAITNVNKPITVISKEYKLEFKTSFVPSENMISFINNKRQHISHNLENNMISLSPSRVVMVSMNLVDLITFSLLLTDTNLAVY